MAHILVKGKAVFGGLANFQPVLIDTDEIVGIELKRKGIGGEIQNVVIITNPPIYNVNATTAELKEIILVLGNSIKAE